MTLMERDEYAPPQYPMSRRMAVVLNPADVSRFNGIQLIILENNPQNSQEAIDSVIQNVFDEDDTPMPQLEPPANEVITEAAETSWSSATLANLILAQHRVLVPLSDTSYQSTTSRNTLNTNTIFNASRSSGEGQGNLNHENRASQRNSANLNSNGQINALVNNRNRQTNTVFTPSNEQINLADTSRRNHANNPNTTRASSISISMLVPPRTQTNYGEYTYSSSVNYRQQVSDSHAIQGQQVTRSGLTADTISTPNLNTPVFTRRMTQNVRQRPDGERRAILRSRNLFSDIQARASAAAEGPRFSR